MNNDYLKILVGILFCLIAAWSVMPLVWRCFSSSQPTAYLLSKPIGLLLVALINFNICSFRIIPMSPAALVTSVLLCAAVAWGSQATQLPSMLQHLRGMRRGIIASELAFACAFLILATLRMLNPDLASAEKPADAAILSSLLRTDYLPPPDAWFSGKTVSYFYFGHYVASLLGIWAPNLNPAEVFNLAIGMYFALAASSAAGLGYILTRSKSGACLTALFITLAGNLEAFRQVIVRFGSPTPSLFPSMWFDWWRCSRVIVRPGIDETINEFPFWSFTLGDLHAHVMALPFSILALATAAEFFRRPLSITSTDRPSADTTWRVILAAAILGAVAAINPWDGITTSVILLGSLLLGQGLSAQPKPGAVGPLFFQSLTSLWKSEAGKGASTCVAAAAVLLLARLFYLPFHLSFGTTTAIQGVGLVDPIRRTPLLQFLNVHGAALFFLFVLICALYASTVGSGRRFRPPLVLAALALPAAAAVCVGSSAALCILLIVLLLWTPCSASDSNTPPRTSLFFISATALWALALLLGCEWLFLKDPYGRHLQRMNSVFKFHYQAWVLLGTAAAYSVFCITGALRNTARSAWLLITALWLVATLTFVILGPTTLTSGFARFREHNHFVAPTLDGIQYIRMTNPFDSGVIDFLRRHATPRDVILEATGDPFSYYARIATHSGVPTVIGWANHEGLWRPESYPEIAQRIEDVRTLYMTPDDDLTRKLLAKYNIRYIVVSELERSTYPHANFDKFAKLGSIVWETQAPNGCTNRLYACRF